MKLGLWLAMILLLMAAAPAWADIAPPAPPPGVNPSPGEERTKVRMVSEKVVMAVTANAPEGSLGQARVTADFAMRNLGTEPESMAVRFPISADDGFGEFPEIRDLVVRVNGYRVDTRRSLGPEIRYGRDQVPWAEFDVAFPSGEDVAIQVIYTLDAYGYSPYASFEYILETGSGWHGTIGSAELIARLPFEASAQNVLLGQSIGLGPTTPNGVIAGTDISWKFTDLEPTRNDNLQVVLVMPSVWRTILTERDNIARSPNDGEAWGRLARAYKEITFGQRGRFVREDAGAHELYQLGVEAYEQTLALLPQDALWHVGFADLLAQHAYFGALAWLGGIRGGADAGRTLEQIQADAGRAIQEMRTAQAIAPEDPKVLEIAEQIEWLFPDSGAWTGGPYTGQLAGYGPMVPRPTPTPVAPTTSTQLTPALVTAEATIKPAAPEATPITEAEADSSGMPCGATAAGALPVALILATRGRRSRSS